MSQVASVGVEQDDRSRLFIVSSKRCVVRLPEDKTTDREGVSVMFKGLAFACWFVAVGGFIGGGYEGRNLWLMVALVVAGVVCRFFQKWFADE